MKMFGKSVCLLMVGIVLLSCKSESLYVLPELGTTDITDITQTTARSGGNIVSTGGADIISKGVCWDNRSNPKLSNYHTNDGSGIVAYASTLTGLLPDTEYHVRAYATNKTGTAYGEEKVFWSLSDDTPFQIIADHTVVDKYDDIPQYYIDKVKEMWLVYAGESHSSAVRTGLAGLESTFPAYAVNGMEYGTPEAYTASHLRVSRATWGDLDHETGWIYDYGEEDWFTSALGISRTKAGITYCNTNNLTISAMGFGWCWDPTSIWPAYLSATQEYIDYCTTNGYQTKIFFTTGPVDGPYISGEIGYKSYLRWEEIRRYAKAESSRILFDYADILCYDSGSETPNTATWDGQTYPIITEANLLPDQTGHISNTGALRLAKAMWWMLARMAGWGGD